VGSLETLVDGAGSSAGSAPDPVPAGGVSDIDIEYSSALSTVRGHGRQFPLFGRRVGWISSRVYY
jgi:hypothetical protein